MRWPFRVKSGCPAFAVTNGCAAAEPAWAGVLVLVTSRWLGPARPLLERALRIREAIYGPDDRWVALALTGLGRILTQLGHPTDAVPRLRRALQIHQIAGCPDQPDAATTLTNLSRALVRLDQPAQAHHHLDQALKINEASFGPDHPKTIHTHDELHSLRDT